MKTMKTKRGGSRLANEAEKNAVARKIQKDINSWAKKTLKGG